jgi:DNA-binding transcriptional LysR family regulator
MDLTQLEMFVAAVEERSFLRAAERVFRTQPAVSIGLRKLEGRIGAPLLDRSHRRSRRLTPAGEVLCRRFDAHESAGDLRKGNLVGPR